MSFSDAEEMHIARFEQAWRAACDSGFAFEPDVLLWRAGFDKQPGPPELEGAHNDRRSDPLLDELVAIDQEMRWRHDRGPRGVEAYLHRLCRTRGWNKEDAPLEMVLNEYRAQMRWGERPSRADFVARFPKLKMLADALAAVDAELLLERVSSERQREPIAPLDSHDFQLRRLLGSGGAARVYAAVQRSLDKAVAVKVLKRRWADDPTVVSRFINEAQVAAQVDHSNVVDVHGLGKLPSGELFMVMDLITGFSLREELRRREVSLEHGVAWLVHVADVVDALHRQGVIHGDMQPANILIHSTSDGRSQPYLTDFGLSVRIGGDTHALGATAEFAAPEQMAGDELSPTTDIYGLGAILGAMVRALPATRPITLEACEAISQACMAHPPAERIGNAPLFRQQLHAILEASPDYLP